MRKINDLIFDDADGSLNVIYIASSRKIFMGVWYILMASPYVGRISSEVIVRYLQIGSHE